MHLTTEHWASETSHTKRVKKRVQGQVWSPRSNCRNGKAVVMVVVDGQLTVVPPAVLAWLQAIDRHGSEHQYTQRCEAKVMSQDSHIEIAVALS